MRFLRYILCWITRRRRVPKPSLFLTIREPGNPRLTLPEKDRDPWRSLVFRRPT